MAETAKQDKVIFQSIAEPLLDGQIGLSDGWQLTNKVLLCTVSTIAGISIALFVWTIFKIRKLSAGFLLVEKAQNTLVTNVPSFIYNTKARPSQESRTITFSFEMTWDKANFIIL